MRHQVIARNPRAAALMILGIALFADYLCFDLRYIGAIKFSSGITASSPWFWPIFGAFLGLTLYSVKQLVLPSVLLIANTFGVELRHRVGRPAIRIPWEQVLEITRVQKLVPTKSGQAVNQDGIRFTLNTTEDLNGMVSNSVEVEPGSIFFNSHLFERDSDEVVATLRELRHNAVGQRIP